MEAINKESLLENRIWRSLDGSYFSWFLSAVLVGVYFYVSSDSWIRGASAQTLVDAGALRAELIDRGEFWRLSISLLLHADLLHLICNVTALLALGRIAEAMYGKVRMFGLLYLSGVCGAILSWSMGAVRTVGASGAIFGLLAALSVCGWKYREELREELGHLLRRRLLFWGIFNLLMGLVVPNIDNPSHFGGFFCGCALGTLVGHRWEGTVDRMILAIVSIMAICSSMM